MIALAYHYLTTGNVNVIFRLIFYYLLYEISVPNSCFLLVFTHLSTWKYLRQIAWKCTIWNEELQKFSGDAALPSPRPLPYRTGRYPLPAQPPRRLWRLDARAFHRQLPRMSSDRRNAPAELINIVLQWSAGSDAEPDFQLIYEDKSR